MFTNANTVFYVNLIVRLVCNFNVCVLSSFNYFVLNIKILHRNQTSFEINNGAGCDSESNADDDRALCVNLELGMCTSYLFLPLNVHYCMYFTVLL